MKVMASSVRWLRMGGILTDENGISGKSIIKWTLFAVFILHFVVPQIAFMKYKAKNIVEMAPIVYAIVTFLGNVAQFLVLHMHKADIKRLLMKLQMTANQMSLANNTDNFQRAEVSYTKLCGLFEKLGFFSYILYVMMPAGQIIYAHITDSITKDTYQAPFNDLYFFDTSYTPVFEICYLLTMFDISAILAIFLTIDLFFFGITLHTVAMYNELIHMVQKVAKVPDSDRFASLVDCVDFHKAIFNFIESGNHIMENIIFVQFLYSVLTLVTNVFAASYADSTELIVLFTHFLLHASELFIFCWTGSMVLNKSDDLRLELYYMPWLEFKYAERQMVRMMMIRTLRPAGYGAFRYLYYNTEIYVEIMSNVFSAYAFLKSVI